MSALKPFPKNPPRIHCEGSDQAASAPGETTEVGICPGCGLQKMVYDSNRRGRGIMVDHDRTAKED